MGRKSAAAAKRKATFDAEIAEARELIADLKAPEQMSADPRPAGPSEQTVDVAELVAAEFERQRRANIEAAEAAEIARRAHPDGSGCAWCGIAYSNTDHEEPWTSADGQLVCIDDWNWHVIHTRVSDTPADRRVRVIAALLGLDGLPLLAVGAPHAFDGVKVWFSEFSDAAPHPERRWAHIDLAELRRSWDRVIAGPEPPPPPTRRGPKCPDCGGRDYLVLTDQPVSHWPIEGAEIADEAYFERLQRSTCVTCRRNWLPQAGGVPA
jgi:hypothetical protein